jgi:uncharacterized protein involved in outer membrane biogenesis
LKWLAGIVAAVVLLTAAAIVALPRLIDVPRVQALVAANASQALGRPVRFASLSISVFPLPGVTLHKLEVADDPQFGPAPFLTLDSGYLRLRLRPLLTGRLEFAELVLAKPVITVIRGRGGRLNVSSLGASPEPRTASRPSRPGSGGGGGASALAMPGAVKITDGVVVYVAQAGSAAPTRYRIEDLDVKLEVTGPQVGFQGSARVMPGGVALKITDGIVTPRAGAPGQGFADATVRAKVGLETDDVSPLVATIAGPATTVAGALKGTLAVAGTVAAPTAAGDVKLSKLTIARVNPHCPEPKRRTLAIPAVALNAGWAGGRLTGQPMQAEIAKGSITARLTADVLHGMRVQLDDLAVKGMALEPVLVDFLCQGYAVSGPLDLTGGLAFAAARPLETLSGPGTLKIGPGKIVGKQALSLIGNVVRVGGALQPGAFASPVEFDSIAGTYRITDGIATTRDLVYTSRAMKVAVAGDYVLVSGAMNLDMVLSHARGDLRAKVTGTAAAPSIRIVPASVLQNLDRDKVESGLRDLLKRFR